MAGKLNKADFLKAAFKTEDVVVPEMGDRVVTIRELTAGDREVYEKLLHKFRIEGDIDAAVKARRMLVSLTVIDPETNELMFTMDELADVPDKIVDRISVAANKLCEPDDAAIEDAEKN